MEFFYKHVITINISWIYTLFYLEEYSNNLASRCSCRSNWYYTSGRCRKLLFLIMNRSALPCKITAGKIVPLTIENFGTVSKHMTIHDSISVISFCVQKKFLILLLPKVLKTMMSYFTMMRSFNWWLVYCFLTKS